ncbi:MAG: hypothetical protein ABA06_01455 [Parcubacteria bacterium C7867-001]|nr:MAG: hypothetical protein ABA06_01455 [Parcubacteria bacterium C7867-001]
MTDKYLMPVEGGRWAISRRIHGRTVYLIQDTSLFDSSDAEFILTALSLEPTRGNMDHYFPKRDGSRCPTLELMELCNVFIVGGDPTKAGERKPESGV